MRCREERDGGKLDWELIFKRQNKDKSLADGGSGDLKEFDDGSLNWEDLESLQIHSFDL